MLIDAAWPRSQHTNIVLPGLNACLSQSWRPLISVGSHVLPQRDRYPANVYVSAFWCQLTQCKSPECTRLHSTTWGRALWKRKPIEEWSQPMDIEGQAGTSIEPLVPECWSPWQRRHPRDCKTHPVPLWKHSTAVLWPRRWWWSDYTWQTGGAGASD
jgi:hypothetical protein